MTLRVNVQNMLRHAAGAIPPQRDAGACRYMLGELAKNLQELRDRTAAGDLDALNEFFALYVFDDGKKYVRTALETSAAVSVPVGHFLRGDHDRQICKHCGGHWGAHIHTDEASWCPTLNTFSSNESHSAPKGSERVADSSGPSDRGIQSEEPSSSARGGSADDSLERRDAAAREVAPEEGNRKSSDASLGKDAPGQIPCVWRDGCRKPEVCAAKAHCDGPFGEQVAAYVAEKNRGVSQ